jgi:enoyl-CoA hydratase/carnithine racemase
MAEAREASVTLEVTDGVAEITFGNGPLNLLTREVRDRLGAAVRSAGRDPRVRVVLLTGAGSRAFSVGSDVKELQATQGAGSWSARARHELELYETIDALPKPTLAAIQGYCLGGGLELALACDLRVCGGESEFGFPEVGLGVFPSGGGTERLPRLIGEARAKELMLLGARIGADEASRLGLVNRVAPRGDGLAAGRALARELAARPALAVQAIVRVVEFGRERPIREGSAAATAALEGLSRSADLPEGIAAFLEKRPPRFTHG